MKKDYIYFNVKSFSPQKVFKSVEGKLERDYEAEGKYKNQHLEYLQVIINFLKRNKLLEENSLAWETNFLETVIKHSDLNLMGRAFLESGEITKWHIAHERQYNRNPEKDIKMSPEKLQKRFDKFMADRKLQ